MSLGKKSSGVQEVSVEIQGIGKHLAFTVKTEKSLEGVSASACVLKSPSGALFMIDFLGVNRCRDVSYTNFGDSGWSSRIEMVRSR